MEARERLDRFDLQDQTIGNEQIDSISDTERYRAIGNRHCHLSTDRSAPKNEFLRETLLIDRFQQPRPQRTVNRQPSINRKGSQAFEVSIDRLLFFSPFSFFQV